MANFYLAINPPNGASSQSLLILTFLSCICLTSGKVPLVRTEAGVTIRLTTAGPIRRTLSPPAMGTIAQRPASPTGQGTPHPLGVPIFCERKPVGVEWAGDVFFVQSLSAFDMAPRDILVRHWICLTLSPAPLSLTRSWSRPRLFPPSECTSSPKPQRSFSTLPQPPRRRCCLIRRRVVRKAIVSV